MRKSFINGIKSGLAIVFLFSLGFCASWKQVAIICDCMRCQTGNKMMMKTNDPTFFWEYSNSDKNEVERVGAHTTRAEDT